MANSREFVSHALDLVGLVGPVHARAMFGGHGLYHRGAMFGLLDDDELFLKVDGETRPRFLAAGCRAWEYVGRHGAEQTSYFRPPDEAHEDPEAMLPWARLAVDAALRGAARRAKAAKRPRATAAERPARGSAAAARPSRSAGAKPGTARSRAASRRPRRGR